MDLYSNYRDHGEPQILIRYRKSQNRLRVSTTMDPASAIIGIASGAAALVAMTGQLVSYLIRLRDDTRNLEVILLDLVLACQAYESAWTHIRTWLLESWDPGSDEGEPIIQEFCNFLEGGKVMMEFIRADLDRLSSTTKPGNWGHGLHLNGSHTARLLLHKNTVVEHRDRIHCQNTSLHLLLSCAKLSFPCFLASGCTDNI